MCQDCVDKGLMTQEELNKQFIDGPNHINRILESLRHEQEELVINVLLSCLINASYEMNISSLEVIAALIQGFSIPINEKKNKEMKH